MTLSYGVLGRLAVHRMLSSCLCLLLSPILTHAQTTAQLELDLPKLTRALPARLARQQDLETRYQDFHKEFEDRRKKSTPIADDDRDEEIFRKRFDLLWSIDDAVTTKQALDLSAVGFQKVAEGRYSLKQEQAAQWMPLYMTLGPWSDVQNFDRAAEQLRERGLRNEDLARLREYLIAHGDPNANVEKRNVFDKMAETIQARRGRGLNITTEEFKAFKYQLRWTSENAQRRWAAGMFDVLDPRGQRILASVVDEMNERSQYALYITAPPEPDKQLQQEIDFIASGAYAKYLDAQQSDKREGAR